MGTNAFKISCINCALNQMNAINNGNFSQAGKIPIRPLSRFISFFKAETIFTKVSIDKHIRYQKSIYLRQKNQPFAK